ncbi:MAG: class I SAM-dependent methyltransferase [Planctomycetota bacterium]|nr:class I SAM-dependent methyltransferase [Planctomycetota bacterium]
MKESYSRSYVELWRDHWWWQSRHQIVLRELDRWRDDRGPNPRSHSTEVNDRPALLDIGCAGGVAFDDWSRYGEVYGIEPDAHLIDPASRWIDRIEQTAFDRDYLISRRYDVVLMLDVLEHIEDDRAALSKVFDALKPGGIVILTVPALPSLWSVHDDVNLHFRRYTKPSLRHVIHEAGFTCRDMRYLFGWSLGMVYARKWLSRKKPDSYAVSIPPRPINAAMRVCSLAESWIAATFGLPVLCGSSLLAVFVRPDESESSRDPVSAAIGEIGS